MKTGLPILLLFISLQLSAQIVITRADYTAEIDVPITKWSITDAASIPAPEEGENLTWDYSGIMIDTSAVENFPRTGGTDPDVGGNILVPTLLVAPVPGVFIPAHFVEQLDDDGFGTVGRRSFDLDLSITALSGGENDSLNFLESFDVYESTLERVVFPLEYGYMNEATLTTHIDYLLTVEAFGLDHTPGHQENVATYEYETSGWGTLIIPDALNDGTLEMEALLLKRHRMRVDSFYLGGSPAPQALLDAFGIEQGATITDTAYYFFAKGMASSPLSLFTSPMGLPVANTYTGTAAALSSTKPIAEEFIPLTLSPNPSAGDISLQFDKTDNKPWIATIYDIRGQVIHQQTIDAYEGATTLNMTIPMAAAGIHQLMLRNSDGLIIAQEAFMLK